jgi:hypothetical protein
LGDFNFVEKTPHNRKQRILKKATQKWGNYGNKIEINKEEK